MGARESESLPLGGAESAGNPKSAAWESGRPSSLRQQRNWALKAQTFEFFMAGLLKETEAFLGFTVREMGFWYNRQ